MNKVIHNVDPLATQPWNVKEYINESSDTFTIVLEPEIPTYSNTYEFNPGQFNMLYVFGVGEIPISICSDPKEKNRISHTTRIVGTVTRALSELKVGDAVGVRGPFGNPWPVIEAKNQDVIIIAGGIGLAPLRPAIYHILENRDDYNRVALLYGARTQTDILYREELEQSTGCGGLCNSRPRVSRVVWKCGRSYAFNTKSTYESR